LALAADQPGLVAAFRCERRVSIRSIAERIAVPTFRPIQPKGLVTIQNTRSLVNRLPEPIV
jgi:hypothetical protein